MWLATAVVLVGAAVPAATAGVFTQRGTVTRVLDGDTFVVKLANGRSTRVRLLGIDTPERGACYANAAAKATKRLAGGKEVRLTGDRSQRTRDRYGRLLAYATVRGQDVGRLLVAGGFATTYAPSGRFARLAAYRKAEGRAKRAKRGLWKACRKQAGGTTARCHPSYSPCLSIVDDLDCGEIPKALKPVTVKVPGVDPYRLDADGDGVGCERG